MNRVLLVIIGVIACLCAPEGSIGQNVLAENSIRGLRDLSSVAVVIRPSTEHDYASASEWGDRLEVMLSHALPELGRSDTENASAWLELSVATSSRGAALELSLYRWTKIQETGEDVFSQVWSDSRYLFGSAPKESLNQSLEILVTEFAADYLRSTY